MQGGDDLSEMRRQLLQFERAINKNQEMRLKSPNEPHRFIESEVDLNAELRGLAVLTAHVAVLYPEFLKLGMVRSVVGLLTHDNADIAAAAISVLEELTDEDVLDGDADAAAGAAAMQSLVDALCAEQAPELLVSNLSRFHDTPPAADDVAALENYESDMQAVYHTLGVLENIVTLRPALAETLCTTTSLLSWLLQRMQRKTRFDQNMGYAGELLAILLQDSEVNRKTFGTQNGLDGLLQVLAVYRRRDPVDDEETEFSENVVDALCSALLVDENRPRFVEAEGVELMVILLR